MKYFKNKQGNLFADPSIDVIKNHQLQEISEEEFNKILTKINTPSEEDLKRQRISKLQELLSKTDHKVLPDYDQDSTKVKEQRQQWREEIRKLKEQFND
jgi:hypothetical protein